MNQLYVSLTAVHHQPYQQFVTIPSYEVRSTKVLYIIEVND